MRTFKNALTLLIFCFVTIAATAQTNFSGTWKIDKQKIDFGGTPGYVLPVSIQVTQKSTQVSIRRESVDAQGNASNYTENFEGTDTMSTTLPSGIFRKAELSWTSIKNSFVIHSVSNSKITETWTLADNGQTLIIDRDVEQENGLKYTIKGYYTKQ
jgi:hypothetical protein